MDKSIDSSALIAQFQAKPEQLVQILHQFVAHFGYIDDQAVRQIADALNLSVAEVYGVVHFYEDFRTNPPGKRILKICQAESCQAMGSRRLTKAAEQLLGTKLDSTTSDGATTLESVYCLGNCACSPAVMLDGKVFGRVDAELLNNLVGSSNT